MDHLSLQIIRQEHMALAAMLRSLVLMLDRGPDGDEDRFFDVVRAMLFYIDEFPERMHHPKESKLLFPKVALRASQVASTIERLNQDHANGEHSVRELQHQLLAWELLGPSRRSIFEAAARRYVDFYLEHMRVEEMEVLPAALKTLEADDWKALDAAFAANRDPLADNSARTPQFERLFTRIVTNAPAPIGLG
ncbi:MAG: hemerythrin domain-containing protein [Burkholderiales bacterium]